MDDVELAALEHANLIEANVIVGANAKGAIVRRDGGIAMIATGLPVRLFNQVLVEAEGASPMAIAEALATMRERGDHFVVNLRVGTDDVFLPLMDSLGLQPLSEEPWIPGMALHPVPAPHAGIALDIRRLTDRDGLEGHVRAAADGFGMSIELVRSLVSPVMLERSDLSFYAAYDHGEPVASGLGVRTGRTIGVYNIATVPSARKRGYGAAMTERVALDGVGAGCDVAVLQASEMGLPIYERLGYRTVVEYMGYVDPPM